jgi:hypothetical protein
MSDLYYASRSNTNDAGWLVAYILVKSLLEWGLRNGEAVVWPLQHIVTTIRDHSFLARSEEAKC